MATLRSWVSFITGLIGPVYPELSALELKKAIFHFVHTLGFSFFQLPQYCYTKYLNVHVCQMSLILR